MYAIRSTQYFDLTRPSGGFVNCVVSLREDQEAVVTKTTFSRGYFYEAAVFPLLTKIAFRSFPPVRTLR